MVWILRNLCRIEYTKRVLLISLCQYNLLQFSFKNPAKRLLGRQLICLGDLLIKILYSCLRLSEHPSPHLMVDHTHQFVCPLCCLRWILPLNLQRQQIITRLFSEHTNIIGKILYTVSHVWLVLLIYSPSLIFCIPFPFKKNRQKLTLLNKLAS